MVRCCNRNTLFQALTKICKSWIEQLIDIHNLQKTNILVPALSKCGMNRESKKKCLRALWLTTKKGYVRTITTLLPQHVTSTPHPSQRNQQTIYDLYEMCMFRYMHTRLDVQEKGTCLCMIPPMFLLLIWTMYLKKNQSLLIFCLLYLYLFGLCKWCHLCYLRSLGAIHLWRGGGLWLSDVYF